MPRELRHMWEKLGMASLVELPGGEGAAVRIVFLEELFSEYSLTPRYQKCPRPSAWAERSHTCRTDSEAPHPGSSG